MSNMIPMGGYPVPLRPYSQITPFTYRDNSTYLEILEQLRKWIQTDLVPHLDTEYAELAASWAANIEELTTAVNTAITASNTEVQAAIDEMVQQVTNNSTAANDPVVTALVNNGTSATRAALNAIYAAHSEVTTVASNLTTTNSTVATHGTHLTTLDGQVSTLQTGLATTNTNLGTINTTVSGQATHLTTLDGQITSINTLIANSMPIGVVLPYGGSTAPTGWFMCNGAAKSRTTYAALFNVISDHFGAGDGSTTFNIPDMGGRIPAGKATSGTFANLGGMMGEETHTLSINEIPSHNHSTFAADGLRNNDAGNTWAYQGVNTQANTNTGNAGGGAAHNNIQPSIVMNYIIKYQ